MMNRKELKLKKVQHQKHLNTIELSRLVKTLDYHHKDLFTIVYDKQNKTLCTSKKLVHSFYDFIKMN